MSMRAPYILLSSSKAAAARAFHPSVPSPVRGSSVAATAAAAAAPRRAKPLATSALVVLCRSVTKRDIAASRRVRYFGDRREEGKDEL